MESDDLSARRTTTASYLSGCMTPPACFPPHEETEYTRLGHVSSSSASRNSRRWRRFLWRLVRDSKNMGFCGIPNQKSISFNYDAVSYSQNFDEGCHAYEDQPRRRSLVYSDVIRWDNIVHKY
ncbi:hypothetical protein TIFTF001_004492 [Ficus carica]|uniref:Uncharacterized protein n=1 Tax=Ficus carica TaxID=3494 RepID=A0AA87ZGE9_FICCA|nr:hypothetical protein TIFTF001_004492 [Ficus carica]